MFVLAGTTPWDDETKHTNCNAYGVRYCFEIFAKLLLLPQLSRMCVLTHEFRVVSLVGVLQTLLWTQTLALQYQGI